MLQVFATRTSFRICAIVLPMEVIVMLALASVNTIYYLFSSFISNQKEVCSHMVTKQLNLRVDAEDVKDLEEIAQTCGLNRTALSVLVLKSAIKAIRANGNRFQMPLVLAIVAESATSSSKGTSTVSYTHLTLPTKRIV